jgi:hypothetical protein
MPIRRNNGLQRGSALHRKLGSAKAFHNHQLHGCGQLSFLRLFGRILRKNVGTEIPNCFANSAAVNFPLSHKARIPSSCFLVVFLLAPPRRPRARAVAKPAIVLSRIRFRSNSANTAKMWKIRFTAFAGNSKSADPCGHGGSPPPSRHHLCSEAAASSGSKIPPAVADMMMSIAWPTLKDVRRAYWSALPCIRSSGGVAFAVVAKDAQLEHIVGLTQWLASPCIPPS